MADYLKTPAVFISDELPLYTREAFQDLIDIATKQQKTINQLNDEVSELRIKLSRLE